MTEKLLLNGIEASKFLGVSNDDLKDLRTRLGLPFVLIGKRYLYPVDALRLWVQTQTRTVTT